MPPTARISDLGVGVCCCHKSCIGMVGVLVTGAGTVIAEGMPTSRIGDVMLGFCGHVGIMVTGSSTVIAEGSNVCRIGDLFVGCFIGNVVTGAGTVITGG